MIVKELMTLLGFKVDHSGAKQYEEVFNRLKKLAITAAAAIGLTELTKSIIETTTAWQRVNLQLSYIIGNSEKAHALMLQMNELAGRSVFNTEELGGYAKELINFGFSVNEINPLMQRLSNIAVVLGKDSIPMITEALARMKQRGYADARVMMELFHAGIPIQDELAKRFGVTNFQMNRLIQEGRVGFRDVYDALTALTTGTGKFAGANEAYARTLEGRWKSVMHIIEDLKVSLGTSLLPVVEDLIGRFKDWLDLNKGHIADDFMTFLNDTMYAIGWIGGVIYRILASLGLVNNKPKEVTVSPTPKLIPTGIPLVDRIRNASMPQGAPEAPTRESIAAAQAAEKARIDKALQVNTTNNFTFNGLAGDSATAQNIARLTAQAAEEAQKKAIRKAAPNFAGGMQ